jgi:hypothetical protein
MAVVPSGSEQTRPDSLMLRTRASDKSVDWRIVLLPIRLGQAGEALTAVEHDAGALRLRQLATDAAG